MQTKYTFSAILITALLIVAGGCGPTSPSAIADTAAEEETVKGYTSLLDLLRTEPHLNISGSGNNATIRIRGNKTLIGNNEPLFVLDGTPLGNGYASASSVDVNNVQSVRVLSGAKAAIYGSRGGNGVVEIRTK